MLICAINVASLVLQCGLGECHTSGYRLLTSLIAAQPFCPGGIETRAQAMDLAQQPEVAHERILELEERRAVPPDPAIWRGFAKERAAMNSVEAQLARYAVAFFHQLEDSEVSSSSASVSQRT